jgi:hypothetical protein
MAMCAGTGEAGMTFDEQTVGPLFRYFATRITSA